MGPLAHSLAALAALLLLPPALIGLALRRSWREGIWERLSVRVPTARARDEAQATSDAHARGETSETRAHGEARATSDARAREASRARPVWLHAASVGEASAALPLVDALAARLGGVVVTTTTVTGRALLRARRPGIACALAPLDHPWTAARALAVRDPAALVLVETELWPCLLHAAAARDVPVVVVSGRLSERSFRRIAWARRWLARSLAHIALLGARSERDAEHFAALGVKRARIVISGDLKLETAPPDETPAPPLARALADAPLWIAGSTHAGEEAAALDALDAAEAAGHALALLLAPRRPERFEQVAQLVRARGRTLLRRSELERAGQAARVLRAGEVLLLDSLGELAPLWARARLAFVGGTLAPVGGHNLLEPVARGVPVFFGPHTENAREAAALLAQHGAGVCVADARALTREVLRALAAPEAFRARGERGRAMLGAHCGASARSLALIERAVQSARHATARARDERDATLPTSGATWGWYETHPTLRRRAALLPLSLLARLWALGAWLHRAWYERGPGRATCLPCAVISVGNLVVGGSGKTPTVALLASALRARGRRVAIASRGYGGRTARAVEVVSDGRRVHGRFESSGDEPMWLASRAPGVPVLVGRRRDVVGRFAVSVFETEVLLLDDGFQHHRLARDVNLLTFHGAGLGNARVLPRGPLRESLGALARADAVLVVDGPLPARDVARIRRAAPDAAWFAVERTPGEVRALAGGAGRSAQTLAGREVGLLCGVARPHAVRASLEALGARVVAARVFSDHHAYTERDLAGLGAEASHWITTEKDAGKIPPSFVRGFALEVLALETKIVDAPRFLDWLEERLQKRRA